MPHPRKTFSKINFALLQYPLDHHPQKNLVRVLHLLEKKPAQRMDYIVLPEMWLGSPQQPGERIFWSQFYKQALGGIRHWCKKNQVGCFLSGLEKNGSRFFNTAYWIEADGRIGGTYRKIHLFSFGGETKIFSAGSGMKIFETRFGKIGIVICYDIRFPEFISKLAMKGANVLVVCAQWPNERLDHWLCLLKARAIENQIFVVATNRLGRKGKNTYRGHSLVMDPWGRELLHLTEKEKWGIARIDLKMLEEIRKKFPFFKERKRF